MDLLYAVNPSVRPIQASQWKKQLFESASELFTRGKKTEAKAESQAKEEESFQQFGKLQMEPEWLNKNFSSCDARELRRLIGSNHPELSVNRQSELLGLPRSTHYYRPTPRRESTLGVMARINALYLEDPCSGSRRMVDYLVRESIPISRDRVQSLMRRMVFRVIY